MFISQDPTRRPHNIIGAPTVLASMICASAWLLQPGSTNWVQDAKLMHCEMAVQITMVQCNS